MMPISVRDNSWAIGAGAQRANDTINRFNQGLMSVGKEFGDATIKARLYSGEQNQKDNEELQRLWGKIQDNTATDEEVERYNKLNDDRSLWQKAKDLFSSPMPSYVHEAPEYDDETVKDGEIIRQPRQEDRSIVDTSKVIEYDKHGNPLSGSGNYENIDVQQRNDVPRVKFNLGDPHALDSMPQPTEGELTRAKAKAPNLKEVDLPLRAAETAGINTGYVPYSEQDRIKDNQRFTDEQAYQEAVRKAEASSIDNLRKQGDFNANENVLAEAINKQGDLTPNEKVATVNSIAKIKGIAPVEAAAENMSQNDVNKLANQVRGITEGPLAGKARKALANIESQGLTVTNILELAKVNALSSMNLPYDKANSTDVQAAIQSSIMKNANSDLIKQNSQKLIGNSRMEAREFTNSFNVPDVHRSGQFAPQQEPQQQEPQQQEPQINETIQTMNNKWNELNDEQRIEILEIMGMI
jgi:hypothetical protein